MKKRQKNHASSCPDCRGTKSKNLSILLRCYRQHHHALREMLADFKELKLLSEAIHFGAGAIHPRCPDTMYDHQKRIGRRLCSVAASHLKSVESEIRKCKSFESLIASVEKHTRRVPRFGKLAVYDTALRIAANRGKQLLPKAVYLHAGTRRGMKKWKTKYPLDMTKEYLEVSKLPLPLRKLKLQPHEMEDFLCIYKDHFKP